MGRKPIYRSHGDRYREGVTSVWASIAELESHFSVCNPVELPQKEHILAWQCDGSSADDSTKLSAADAALKKCGYRLKVATSGIHYTIETRDVTLSLPEQSAPMALLSALRERGFCLSARNVPARQYYLVVSRCDGAVPRNKDFEGFSKAHWISSWEFYKIEKSLK